MDVPATSKRQSLLPLPDTHTHTHNTATKNNRASPLLPFPYVERVQQAFPRVRRKYKLSSRVSLQRQRAAPWKRQHLPRNQVLHGHRTPRPGSGRTTCLSARGWPHLLRCIKILQPVGGGGRDGINESVRLLYHGSPRQGWRIK